MKDSMKPTSRTIPQKTQRFFEKYIIAMVNFYGRITLKDAFDTIQYQNDASYNYDEFIAYAKKRRSEIINKGKDYHFYFVFLPSDIEPGSEDDPQKIEFLHELFAYSDDEYNNIVTYQKMYPRYIPKKNDLLRYADYDYWPDTDKLRTAVDWVFDHQRNDLPFKLTYADVATEILIPMEMNSDANSAAADLLRWIEFPKEKDEELQAMKELANLLLDINDNTRSWRLHGHTPIEAGLITSVSTESL